MSCANCSSTITEALTQLEGVGEVDVNFATDAGTVEYDPEQVSLAEIYDAIEDSGYEPVAETLSVGITDMTCANCSQTVESAVSKLPGVVASTPTTPPTRLLSNITQPLSTARRSTTPSRTRATRPSATPVARRASPNAARTRGTPRSVASSG